MIIDGSIVLVVIGGLIGVIWAMLNRRINKIEEERKDFKALMDKIFSKQDLMIQKINNIEVKMAESYITKIDCAARHKE